MDLNKTAADLATGIVVRVPWVRIILALLGVVAVLFGAYKLAMWVFGDPEKIRAKADVVVAQEETARAQVVTRYVTDKTATHYETIRVIDRTVETGQKEIADAWTGETVGADVDAAGAAALCGLHVSLCRRPGPDGVHEDSTPPDAGADPAHDAPR